MVNETANQILETIVLEEINKIGFCDECGRKYNSNVRQKQVEDFQKPNTAGKYCSNSCWVAGTAAQEYA